MLLKYLFTISFTSLWSSQSLALYCDNVNVGLGITVPLPTSINYTGGRENSQLISSGWHSISNSQSITCTLTAVEQRDGADIKVYVDPVASFSGKRVLLNGTTYDVFNTGTPGIGMIGEVRVTGDYLPLINARTLLVRSVRINSSVYNFGMHMRVQLVALAPLSPGRLTVPGLPLATQWVGPASAKQAAITGAVSSTSINVKNTSCELTVPGSIHLPRVDSSQMPALSDTAGDTVFSISANCGGTYENYQVSYIMTDINSPDNTTSNLKLTQTNDTATGISVQIIDNNNAVIFGPSDSTTGRQTFGTISLSGNTLAKILTARYIRTGTTITPGTVNAGSTITLSYQ
ncbi:fimbrial protein [Pseudomonas sp. OST1909]|uniref:fimbrial protein n=1 Tax=Pseudomonas sp. OST1909 TaxID=2777367 RepID=UPI001886DF82|nr:fimbrial protein [Pseudomonas sp. OST1909]QOY73631.1 fimbrial protein [Pseudomonas sp. OST1909]